MTYDQFIEELRKLIAAGETLHGASIGDREFRDWRFHTENLVVGIQRDGYILPGTFRSFERRYAPNFAPARESQVSGVFERDLGDTLTELRYMVSQFERYGSPKNQQAAVSTQPATTPAPAVSVTTPLAAPERVTVRWLIDNVPVKLWLVACAIALAVFLAGVTVGQIPATRTAVCWLKPDACLQAAPQAKK